MKNSIDIRERISSISRDLEWVYRACGGTFPDDPQPEPRPAEIADEETPKATIPVATPAIKNPVAAMLDRDAEIQKAFAKHTLDVEARRDSKGRLGVYPLPSGDGGGSFEVAGINDRYHPKMAHKLKVMIEDGQHEEAEKAAIEYLDNYTNAVDEWHPDEVVEGYLRCCAFNRGAGGAAWMLQYALRQGFAPSLYKGELDRKVGPKTRAASEKADASILLPALYGARLVYERTVIPGVKGKRLESSKFWHGLFKRFTTDLAFAYSLRKL